MAKEKKEDFKYLDSRPSILQARSIEKEISTNSK
jgi:hypothetical protein